MTLPPVRLTATVIGDFGLVMLLATLPPMRAAFGWLADPIFWPIDGGQGVNEPGARLLLAIGGEIALGWGALIWASPGRGSTPTRRGG